MWRREGDGIDALPRFALGPEPSAGLVPVRVPIQSNELWTGFQCIVKPCQTHQTVRRRQEHAARVQCNEVFCDNALRLSPQSDPIAHNTNAGLLALVHYLASELSAVKSRIDSLEAELRSK